MGQLLRRLKNRRGVENMYPIIEARQVQLPNGRMVIKNIVLIKEVKAVRYADGYYMINKHNVVTRRRVKL